MELNNKPCQSYIGYIYEVQIYQMVILVLIDFNYLVTFEHKVGHTDKTKTKYNKIQQKRVNLDHILHSKWPQFCS